MNDERSIGGVPLLWGFTTLNPLEVAVHCHWCLAWHHHRLTAPPNVVDYYQSHCYARPLFYDRGYWIEPTGIPQARVYDMGRRARPWEARLLAAGKTTPSIQRRQAARGPRPPVHPAEPPEGPRKPRAKPYGPRWPQEYPQVPEEPDEAFEA